MKQDSPSLYGGTVKNSLERKFVQENYLKPQNWVSYSCTQDKAISQPLKTDTKTITYLSHIAVLQYCILL